MNNLTPLQHTMQRVQERRAEEPRRALDPDTGIPIPLPAEPRKLTLIDKVRLLYRATKFIKTMKKKSWKTSVAGIATILGGIATALKLYDAGDLPGAFLAISTSFASGIGLMSARDDGVTSEQAGAR